MMKIIDKIKKHAEHDHEAEKAEQAAAAAAAAAAEKKREKERGPKMHPDLLELYDVTDHVLGVGTFATVKEIVLKSTGKKYALKIILKKTLKGKSQMLDTEISVLSKVRHPNCVSLLEMFETEDAVYLVTDLAEGGELFDQLLKKGFYTEGDAARLVYQILQGVEYLHSLGIVHRDLKPENLLFEDKSENAKLMITDFGLSKVLTNGNDVLMTACGTPGYVAPEVLEQIGHGKPVDMWSIGALTHPWFRAVLEQDMITPVSPAESVNLMPGMRKNFNARQAFKKAVRAVGLIKKMAGAQASFSSGEDTDHETVIGGKKGRPSSALSFQDVVNAALLNKNGLNLSSTAEEANEDGVDKVNSALDDLNIKDA
ncbi:hypothetical protein BGX21_003202 [Mortierella sp. AD011]|nr:hypothetical protein BGX21_003202 [Mortierella sp. AD011]